MKITVEIPDDFVADLFEPGEDPARSLFENAIAEAYRHRRINKESVGELLGLESVHDVNAVIGKREVYDMTLAEFQEDLAALEQRRALQSQKTAA